MGESFAADAAARGYSADWDGDHSVSRRRSIREIVSEKSVDWLVRAMLKNVYRAPLVLGSGFDSQMRRQGHDYTDGDYFFPEELLQGPQEGIPESEYYVIYGKVTFRLRDFIAALRQAGLPVSVSGPNVRGHYFIWDAQTQKVRICPEGWFKGGQTPEFIRKSWTTVDHCRKLALVKKDQKFSYQPGEQIQHLTPDFIPSQNIDDYHLVYHDRCGVIKSIELSEFWRLKAPLVTRNCIYACGDHGYESYFSDCYLFANALRIFYETPPNGLQLYLRKEQGTIFEPGFERISVEMDGDITGIIDLKQFLDSYTEEFDGRTVFLVGGGHPCDVKQNGNLWHPRNRTTTLLHYRKALKHAISSGPLDFPHMDF